MIPFGDWIMPVQYSGIMGEHQAVRKNGGVFDISHMGQLGATGSGAGGWLNEMLTNNIDKLEVGTGQYTFLLNEQGGIIDDLIVYQDGPDQFFLIVNAGNRAVDFEWIANHAIDGSEVRDHSDDYALLAVQGPRALERLGLPEAPSFTFADGDLDGLGCIVNRTGYTGEQGVELLIVAQHAGDLWDRVLARGVKPCGLGARDTLRLEVCYPLHGNDIGPETDAISAGLGWVCALDKEFTGSDELRRIKEAGPERRLAAFVMEERGIPRQGMAIAESGEVTSGSHSPMLERGIGLGYVPAELAQPGSELTIDVRGRSRRARVVKKPIYSREET